MSHFTVLVIGDNVEAQLQPYHEFECTGTDDQYVQNIDKTQEIRDRMNGIETGNYNHETNKYEDGEPESLDEALAWYGLEDRVVESEDDLDLEGEHKYGYAIVKNDVLVKAVDRTNPNKKWDWYLVGGRWTGFLKLKSNALGLVGEPGLMTPKAESGYADQAMYGDIDWLGMRTEAAIRAQARYRMLSDFFGGSIPVLEKTWKQLQADESLTWDERRAVYHSQEPLRKIQSGARDTSNPELRDLLMWLDYESFMMNEEQYVVRAWDKALSTFAIVKDSVWYEKGSMGWFATVSNEMEEDAWLAKYNKLLDSCQPNTLLSVVDCHI